MKSHKPSVLLKPVKVTPKRLQALKLLAERPDGVYVSGLAEAILTSDYRRAHKSGFSAQQATRSGAGYATPMIAAGWVGKRDTTHGWGIVYITDAGRKLIADHEATSATKADSNDPELNKLMIRLTIYSQADPSSPDYDREVVNQVLSS